MRTESQRQKLKPKTDLDRLNELIDWYARFKPGAGQVIPVKFTREYMLRQFGKPREDGLWPYRERLLKRVEDE
jgi:hypothetical protein